MDELLKNLKKTVVEPKVYALLVKSARGQVVHIGVHFSLEEAYKAARLRMETLVPHKPGEAMDIDMWNTLSARECIAQLLDPNKVTIAGAPATETVDPAEGKPRVFIEHNPSGKSIIDVLLGMADGDLSTLSDRANTVVNGIEPTVQDHVEDLKEAKNGLIRKLAANGDIAEVEKLGKMLTSNERRYLRKKIVDRNDKDKQLKDNNLKG